MKRLVFNKWYWWISNDPNIWGVGSVYNIEALDIHTNSKYVRLSKSYNNENLLNTRYNWKIIASLYESNANYLELSYDGYLSWILNNDINYWNVINWELWIWCNIGKITNWAWSQFWFLITSNYFTKWAYNSGQYDLWYYASSSTWINTDPNFGTPWSWTIWTWWNITWWYAIHTAWSTAVLSRSMSCSTWIKYRIYTKFTCSAWSCAVKVAWNTMYTLTTSNTNTTLVQIYTSASTSELLEFVPSSDFVWNIDYTWVQEVYATSTSKSFNYEAPYNIYSDFIYIGNGNKITQVDMSTTSPVITDVFTIDNWYTIKGITRISDQFFIYASNGSNSRQYMWDWISTTADRIITWVDKPIQNVANFANIDYVIVWTSTRQQICLVNWYQLQPVIVTNDYVNIEDRIYLNATNINSIETIWNKLLIWWDWGIYSYWSKTPWLWNALVKEFLHNWGSLTNIFYSESLWYSIFAYFTWTIDNWNWQWVFWNYRIQIELSEWNNNEKYWTVYSTNIWWIETNPIFWDTYSNIKNLTKFTIWAKLETDTFINIYIKETIWQYATFYTKNHNSWLAIWDVYTYGWRTFTVTHFQNSVRDWYLIHCSYTGNKLIWKPSWTFTKSSWSGPATMYTDLIRYGYKLLNSFTDITQTRFSANITGAFNETQFAFELWSFYNKKTPKLYDFNLYFDEVTND